MDWKKLLNSFQYAFNGFRLLLKAENNFRFHFLAMLVAVVLGAVLTLTMAEWSVLCIQIALVLSAEALNTALEKLCDFVEPERHPTIGAVKDIAAAAVLLMAMSAVIVGCIIFLPKILQFL